MNNPAADYEARRIVERRWPQKQLEPCNAFKWGEYNPMRCCCSKGHDEPHNYIPVRSPEEQLK